MIGVGCLLHSLRGGYSSLESVCLKIRIMLLAMSVRASFYIMGVLWVTMDLLLRSCQSSLFIPLGSPRGW